MAGMTFDPSRDLNLTGTSRGIPARFALCTCYVSRYLPCFPAPSLPGFGLGDFKLRCRPACKASVPAAEHPAGSHSTRPGLAHVSSETRVVPPSPMHALSTLGVSQVFVAPLARALVPPVSPLAETALPHQPVPDTPAFLPHHIDKESWCSSFTYSYIEMRSHRT